MPELKDCVESIGDWLKDAVVHLEDISKLLERIEAKTGEKWRKISDSPSPSSLPPPQYLNALKGADSTLGSRVGVALRAHHRVLLYTDNSPKKGQVNKGG